MNPIKPLSLPAVLNYKDQDKFITVRDGKNITVLGSSFSAGLTDIQSLITQLNTISSDTLHTTNTSTINLEFIQETRTLSAAMVKDINLSALFPTVPLAFYNNLTATSNMHNRVITLSSEWDKPTVVTLLPDVEQGVDIAFLRLGPGDVIFVSDDENNIRTSWNSSFNLIAFQNSFVFAKKINQTQWCLRGKLGSLTDGKLALDIPPPPTPIYPTETPIPTPTSTPTPTPTPRPLPDFAPTETPVPTPTLTPTVDTGTCDCICDCNCFPKIPICLNDDPCDLDAC